MFYLFKYVYILYKYVLLLLYYIIILCVVPMTDLVAEFRTKLIDVDCPRFLFIYLPTENLYIDI